MLPRRTALRRKSQLHSSKPLRRKTPLRRSGHIRRLPRSVVKANEDGCATCFHPDVAIVNCRCGTQYVGGNHYRRCAQVKELERHEKHERNKSK